MKNLSLVHERIGLLSHYTSSLSSDDVHISIDSPSERAFIAVSSSLLWYDLSTGDIISHADLPSSTSPSARSVLSLQYLPEHESVCCILSSGSILLFSTVGGTSFSSPISAGEIPDGISGAEWSPDQELCALVTSSANLLLLTSDFDVLSDTPDACLTSLNTSISWRADAQVFTTNTGASLRVYDRTGSLISEVADVQVASGCVAWQGDGEFFVTSTIRGSQSKHSLTLFERCGLERASISHDARVAALAFSADDAILGVLDADGRATLFTRSNYAWAAKLRFSQVVALAFDPESPAKLLLVHTNGHIRWCQLESSPSVSSCSSAVALVIDGADVRCTPLGRALIPPPHCAATLSCDASDAFCVAFNATSGRVAVLCVDHTVRIFESEEVAQLACGVRVQPSRVCALEIPTGHFPRLLHWSSHDSNISLILASIDGDELVEFDLSASIAAARRRVRLPDTVLAIADGYLQDLHGRIYALGAEGQSSPHPCFELAVPCARFAVTTLGGERAFVALTPRSALYIDAEMVSAQCSSFCIDSDAILFTNAGPQNVLYVVDRDVPLRETLESADPHARRLIERGAVLIASTETKGVVLQMPRGNLEGIMPRALVLKQLARLCSTRQYRDAFDLARRHRVDLNVLYDGQPNVFVGDVDVFVEQLDSAALCVFIEALTCDNVCDTTFPGYRAIAASEDEGEEEDTVDAALMSLRFGAACSGEEEDEAAAVEPAMRRKICCDDAPTEGPAKINRVCLELRSALERAERPKEEEVVLMTLLRQEPPALSSALSIAASNDDLLRFIVSHHRRHVSHVYEAALARYDLSQARAIAKLSQDMDPKEYSREITAYAAMTDAERRARLDQRAGKHASSIRHLAQMGSEESLDEIVEIVRANTDAYAVSLSVFAYGTSAWRRCVAAHADFCVSVRQFPEAATAYEVVDCIEEAVQAWMSAGNVRTALALASRSNLWTSAQLSELCIRGVVDAAEDCGGGTMSVDERVTLLLQYCGSEDTERAVDMLCSANAFSEAARVAYLGVREDLVLTTVEPALVEAGKKEMRALKEKRERYQQCIRRLRAIRARSDYRGKHMRGINDDEDDGDDTESVVSEMSALSLRSQSSVSSWASRSWMKPTAPKRERRKRKHRIVEGDPREEAFMLKQLRNLTPGPSEPRATSDLILALLRAKMVQKAARLQRQYSEWMACVLQEERHSMGSKAPQWPNELYEHKGAGEQGDAVRVWDEVKIAFLDSVVEEEADGDATADEEEDELRLFG